MNWEQARSFCSDHQAKMVVLESEKESKEIAKMIAHLLAKKWRFWRESSAGQCFRIGGDMKWYRSPCQNTGAPGGFTFNPFCKKLSRGTNKESTKEEKGKDN